MSQHFFPFSCQRRPCLRQFCSCCSILKNFFFYNQTYYKYMLFHTDIKISWVIYMGVFSSVQFSSVAQSCPWTAAHQASLSITNSQSLLKPIPIESVMPSNHLILCHPLLFLPSIFPSIRVFSNKSVLHIRWPKYWSFRFMVCIYGCVYACKIIYLFARVCATVSDSLQPHGL